MNARDGAEAPARDPQFERELRKAGFSKHTILALVYGSNVKTIEELRTRAWGEPDDSFGLHWELAMRPNLGPNGLAEVVAFRETGDPRTAAAQKPVQVVVVLDAAMADDLDAWIGRQPVSVSRREAVRNILAAEITSRPPRNSLEKG